MTLPKFLRRESGRMIPTDTNRTRQLPLRYHSLEEKEEAEQWVWERPARMNHLTFQREHKTYPVFSSRPMNALITSGSSYLMIKRQLDIAKNEKHDSLVV